MSEQQAARRVFKRMELAQEILQARLRLSQLPESKATVAGVARAKALTQRRIDAARALLISGYKATVSQTDALFVQSQAQQAVIEALGDMSQATTAQKARAGYLLGDLSSMIAKIARMEADAGLRDSLPMNGELIAITQEFLSQEPATDAAFFGSYEQAKSVMKEAIERGKLPDGFMQRAQEVAEKLKSIRENFSYDALPEARALMEHRDALSEENKRLETKYTEAKALWTQNKYAGLSEAEFGAIEDAYIAAYKAYKDAHKVYVRNWNKATAKLKALAANYVHESKTLFSETLEALNEGNPVTTEQSVHWANSVCEITPTAAARLKKMGYAPELVLQDMAEFYRFTRGRLDKVIIDSRGDKRANATDINVHGVAGRVYLDGSFSKRTLWHELGHHIEADPAAKAAAALFIRMRADDKNQYTLRSLTKSKFYDSREVAFKDGFFSAYVGKVYRDGMTEVFSMGLETFSDPALLADRMQKDPQTLEFVLGYLRNPKTTLEQLHQSMREAMREMREDSESQMEEAAKAGIEQLSQSVTITPSDNADWLQGNPFDYEISTFGFKSVGYITTSGGIRIALFSGKVRNPDTGRKGNGYVAYLCHKYEPNDTHPLTKRMAMPSKDMNAVKAGLVEWKRVIERDGVNSYPPSFGNLLVGATKERV